MSDRSLRRLPVLAQARHIGISAANWSSTVPSANGGGPRRGGASDVEVVWLSGMERVVDQESQSCAISLGVAIMMDGGRHRGESGLMMMVQV